MKHGVGDGDPQDWTIELAQRWRRFADELRHRLGTGVALDPAVRQEFEGRLGADLSGTMVHRGRLAGQLARAIGAEAITAGQHIVGASERLDAGTSGGAALLGHELAHVIQRTTGVSGDPARAESMARTVEQSLAAEEGGGSGPSTAIDVEVLAERVYRRIVDELVVEGERGAWVRW
jgi:hypothetical protein